ncbi:betaine--homocysteine S-methyltransferase [Rhodobium gokarnense]|nr:betaine--homocysteine S-methyltransferase [Rhodobium gokarnense]
MTLQDLLADKGVLLADGATGTNFFDMGLASGEAPEVWNLEQPDKVRALHRAFVEAGADIILTNTFGANRHRLKLHGLEGRVVELNRVAAQLARAEADAAGRAVLVGGSIGPTGELLVPLGALTYEGAVEAFSEQIAGLVDGGVDILWIETMSAPEEMKAAAEAASRSDLPFTVTASFDTAGKTMMGLSPSGLADLAAHLPKAPAGFGANCGVGASDLLVAVLGMTPEGAVDNAVPVVIAKANCGIPKIQGDAVVYTGTPDLMADYARLAIDSGARIIGGCCGTSPEHLAAMRSAIDDHVRDRRPSQDDIVARIGPLVAPPTEPGAERERGRRRRR